MSMVQRRLQQHVKGAIFAAGCALTWGAGNAAAAPADCDTIIHSIAPYDASIKAGEVELKYGVQRSAAGITTISIHNLDGKVTKLENQGTFPISMTLPTGDKAVFEYSVPTDKPLYDQKVEKLHMRLKHGDDILADTDTHETYLPDEKIKIGACAYDTKHYTQTTAQNGRESRSEIWFAPGLELSLKTVTTVKADDKQMSQTTEVTDLTPTSSPSKDH